MSTFIIWANPHENIFSKCYWHLGHRIEKIFPPIAHRTQQQAPMPIPVLPEILQFAGHSHI